MGPGETASLPCEWEEVEMRWRGVWLNLIWGQARSHEWVPLTQGVIALGICAWILTLKHRSVCDLVLTVSVP